MSDYEIPDWDSGSEARYEQHWAAVLARGLCAVCGEDSALPDSELCGYCAKEMRAADREDEAA